MATSGQREGIREEAAQKKVTEPIHPTAPPNSPKVEESVGQSPPMAAVTPQIVRNKVPTGSKLLITLDPDEEEMMGCANVLPQTFISNKVYTSDERVGLFCDEIFGLCSAENAGEAIELYIFRKLANKGSWIAVWRPEYIFKMILENCDTGDLPFVGVLVEVAIKTISSVTGEEKGLELFQASVSVAEPFSSNIANLRREVVEEVLREHDHSVSILNLYPIQEQGGDVDRIAESLEHARFFYKYIWRSSDDAKAWEYSSIIEKRIQMYYNIQDTTIPGPISKRYQQTLEDYQKIRTELVDFQFNIRGEALPGEAVECWRMYYEMLMLSRLLQFWEDVQPRSCGDFYPWINKRRRGQRSSGIRVTHIVAQMMTPDMIKNVSSDTMIQQHDSLSAALVSCYSGDTVVVLPGEYRSSALTSLTDDIVIKGEGERQEVVFFSDPSQDTFVASRASEVTLSNLTLVQRGTYNGIVVVESGQMTLENCVLKCDGMGVCVLTGASLIMRNCEISGAQGPGVELFPGSVAELHGNQIHHCSNQVAKGSQGAIELKVLPKPHIKMSDNHIHDNHGYGVSIHVPDNCYPAIEKTASGEENEPDHLSKVLQELSLEMNTNNLESNTMGNIGLLGKTWVN